MRIKRVKITNFRSYKEQTIIDFDNLNVFVGKNDIGKSTILEALDIFFNENKGVVKLDKEDINKKALSEGNKNIEIAVVFSELPNNLTIDATNPTTLEDEFLLTKEGDLEVLKIFPNAGTAKVFIKAFHPTNINCADLLLKKQSDLKKILKTQNIDCADLTKNAEIRKSIWQVYSDNLQLKTIDIEIAKSEVKNLWDSLKSYLPLYTLFQSDRKNSDGDNEVQDPMKLAVAEILKDEELKIVLNDVAEKVEKKLIEVAKNTLDKLKEMNPEIADNLNPVIPSSDSLKWTDVFKNVSITGDENIPINKRGSGVKRLVLLNFFRAEAERKRKEKNVPSIIYAIEEPETSQHPNHQRKLIEAFIELSKAENTQIILTSHSPSIVKLLEFEHLKLIKNGAQKEIVNVEKGNLPYPSLNEVNYLAFNEADEEYHNELFGYIESMEFKDVYISNKEKMPYKKIISQGRRKGEVVDIELTMTEYVRHQIHHPENIKNERFTFQQLQESIKLMRGFIQEMELVDV